MTLEEVSQVFAVWRSSHPGQRNVLHINYAQFNKHCEFAPELSKAVTEAKINFKIDNGFQLTYSQEGDLEVFSFASKLNDARAIGYFIANQGLLSIEKIGKNF